MRGFPKRTVTLLLALAAMASGWAGIDEGLAALEQRDYATAFKNLVEPAQKGDAKAQGILGALYMNGAGVQKNERQAVLWFQKSAEQGNPVSQRFLGEAYAIGKGVAADDARALYWWRKAADQGEAEAQFSLGVRYLNGIGITKDLKQSELWLERAAKQDHSKAQLYLGTLLLDQDSRKAAFWWRKAADLNYAQAQVQLGLLYANGEVFAEDYQQAALWWRKAAEQGDAVGQGLLAALLEVGKGIQKDETQAAIWYRRAADQGSVVAQVNLGAMYSAGRGGLPPDAEQAAFWYRKAAERGEPIAQRNLGEMYSNGRGVPQDKQLAISWLKKAAEQNEPTAQLMLGLRFMLGEGVPTDDVQAAFWVRKSAEQGKASAQEMLGSAYAGGFGVPKDSQQAYFWWLLSAAQGNAEAAKLRDAIEGTISVQQRGDAQAAARNWKAQTPKGGEAFDSNRALAENSPLPAPRSQKLAPRDLPNSTGSGFYVANGRVVTNHHVTEGCVRIRIDKRAEGQTVSSDARNDLSLVELQASSTDVASIRIGRVKVGEPATVVGFPLSDLLSGLNVTTGNVSSLAGVGGDTRLLQITAPVQPGNSGGPLLDVGGKVIGVVVSKLNAVKVAQSTGDLPQNVNFAINANVLASFLDANGVDYKSGPTGSPLPTPEVARRAQLFTVLVECWK